MRVHSDHGVNATTNRGDLSYKPNPALCPRGRGGFGRKRRGEGPADCATVREMLDNDTYGYFEEEIRCPEERETKIFNGAM